MKKLVVWYKPNQNTYYYRITKGLYHERYDYKVGSYNSYGHKIVLVIPIYKIELVKPPETSFLTTFINKCSSYLKS